MLRLLVTICLSLLVAAPALAQDDQEQHAYILATATTGGTYYPVGVALATLTKVRLEPTTGVSLSAISSAGSAENVSMLRDNEAQFAILQGLYAAWAWNGEGPLSEEGPQTNLRAVTMLWPNAEHWTIRARFAETGTFHDIANMEGRRLSIGARNSGAEGSGRHVLAAIGIDADEYFELVYQGYGPSAESLQNGVIDAMNTPAGAPVAAVTRAFAADGDNLVLLGFTEEELAAINATYPLYFPYDIPAETYPGQAEVVHSIAHPNILAARADVDEEAVYQITRTIYENLPFLANIHSATAYMALERAIVGLPLPLHPGAIRYYEEAGLEIPDALRP